MSRACSRWTSLGLASLVAWLGCIRKPPPASGAPPTESPPAIHVPAGCLDDLSGAYVHALNPSFHYLASDDGGTLLLAMERSHGDAGVGRPDPNPISVSLSRTARGFVGETRATVFVTSGRTCPVDFPTELIGCEDGGLVLKSAVSSAVDEFCQPSQATAHSLMAEHRLIRAAPPPQASSADAGATTSE